MQLYPEQYYHIYNCSNNDEIVFKEEENYRYFLAKYRMNFENDFDTIAYCLMPTHFHFLIYVQPKKGPDGVHLGDGLHLQPRIDLQMKFGTFLSAYTRAINKRYNRHGSLFQLHTKARAIDEGDIIVVLTYIHQNPVRAGLVKKIEDWDYSSYRDYAGLRRGTLPKQDIVWEIFATVHEFKEYSAEMLECDEETFGMD